MKIGLILAGNIWLSPYVNIYTQILDEQHIDYDIISWNRDGNDKVEGHQFGILQDNAKSRYQKVRNYLKYRKFVKKTILEYSYDKLIIFGPQIALLLGNFLTQKYKYRYIFDYRDLSIEQMTLLKPQFIKVLKSSCYNVISSPGFRKYLPKGFQYILSHNFNINQVRECLSIPPMCGKTFSESNEINVLTIGGIRDYESNSKIITSLANIPGVQVDFVGRGAYAKSLNEYAQGIHATNVMFEGFYKKENEPSIIQRATFINIYYPDIPSHSSALSNRFYNALIYKKPMIVTHNSTQGDYVEKYNLGISITNTENLFQVMTQWLSETDTTSFTENCNNLLRTFVSDYNVFRNIVLEFAQ